MILAIETSAEPASLSLYDGHEMVTRSFPNKNQVNVPLADELQALLEGREGKITTVLVGAGPGSYSGARVGLATAEAVALVHDCAVVTLPSLYGVRDTGAEEAVLIGDARRGAFFLLSVEKGKGFLLEVLDQESFQDKVRESSETHVFKTFEPVEKLPLGEELRALVEVATSCSERLICYWNALDQESRAVWRERVKEVIYLRPPNITKAKNPFS